MKNYRISLPQFRLILIRLEDMQELMTDRADDQALKIHKILKKVPSLSK